ncbi:MAG: tetratricopeptide repeat protein [Gemmatimonadales bacterium]
MRITKGIFSFGAVLVAACVATTSAAISQEPAQGSPIGDAAILRDSGRFSEAIDVLRRHRALNPEDGDAIRMLAQTLYWNKDVRGARALYDSGLVLHPADTALRLQYAQTLMETGGLARAREVLDPLVSGSPPDPRATALVGTLAYWEGDLTSARRNFEKALAADPSLKDARRQLDEIRWLSATWIRTAALGSSDDQPVKSIGGEVETGYYMNPLWSVCGKVRTLFLTESTTTNPNVSSTDLTTLAGSVGISGFIPSSGVDISARAGLFNRNVPSKLDWTGNADLGAKAGSFVRAGVRAERAPYLYTEASLRTHVMTTTVGALLDVDRKGWLGKAAYDRQRFADDNSVSTAYAWAMAPVVRSAVTTLQAGYSISYQNADELRFVRNSVGLTGHYEPYYTPSNTFVQSVIGAFTGRGESGFTARLGGSFGFKAKEDAPAFAVAPNGSFILVTSNRSFHPWNARASVEKSLTNQTLLRAHVDYAKTAFYHVTNAVVELTWRLGPG